MKIDKIIKIIKMNSNKYENIYSGLLSRYEIDTLKRTFNNVIVNEYKSIQSNNKTYVVIDLEKKYN